MASPPSSLVAVCSVVLLLMLTGRSSAWLTTDFYSKSCPKGLKAVKSVVKSAVSKERRMGASLLRLHFHDCFVNGCDGSVLLDDTTTFKGEKTAGPNNNSLRGFEVVDEIKSKVEDLCPGVVSCADILAIAARDSVDLLGGPKWDVKLGRRDSKTASLAAANSGVIPPPSSSLANLISRFRAQGLSPKDMVALSGAHTIGQARCTSFRARIYKDTNINKSFAQARQKRCPRTNGSGDNNLAPLDFQSPNKFDTSYFELLINRRGLLHSDQQLFNGGSTDSLVRKYSESAKTFDADFVEAMIKMGNIKPLEGSKGEIRKNCRKPN